MIPAPSAAARGVSYAHARAAASPPAVGRWEGVALRMRARCLPVSRRRLWRVGRREYVRGAVSWSGGALAGPTPAESLPRAAAATATREGSPCPRPRSSSVCLQGRGGPGTSPLVSPEPARGSSSPGRPAPPRPELAFPGANRAGWAGSFCWGWPVGLCGTGWAGMILPL